MKYLLVIVLTIATFVSGIYYENYRLAGEPDKTIAIMLSKQAIDNLSFQLESNSEYLSLLQNRDYQALAETIGTNTKILAEMKKEAESICNVVQCSNKQQAYISGIKHNGN